MLEIKLQMAQVSQNHYQRRSVSNINDRYACYWRRDGDMPSALMHITRRYDTELDRLVKHAQPC